MLAVKSSLAEQDSTPLMVFDEIDANVGGEIARAVGKKMALLGELHQVIAITHFPQVAATASAHFVVEKEVTNGRTRSKLYSVEGEKRMANLSACLVEVESRPAIWLHPFWKVKGDAAFLGDQVDWQKPTFPIEEI